MNTPPNPNDRNDYAEALRVAKKLTEKTKFRVTTFKEFIAIINEWHNKGTMISVNGVRIDSFSLSAFYQLTEKLSHHLKGNEVMGKIQSNFNSLCDNAKNTREKRIPIAYACDVFWKLIRKLNA